MFGSLLGAVRPGRSDTDRSQHQGGAGTVPLEVVRQAPSRRRNAVARHGQRPGEGTSAAEGTVGGSGVMASPTETASQHAGSV